MKKILLLLMTILSFSINAQDGQLAIELLEHVAYENARSLWGDVHPDNPIPLYNLNDQLIAYTVNFSIGEPFPERESLAESCDQLSKTEDKHSRWQIGSFGHMLISATSATTPIVRYSMTVSDEYAYGAQLEQLAMDYLKTDKVSLERIYLMSDLIKWYCFASSVGKAYVKNFPPVEVYSEDEFKSLVPEKYNKEGLWQLPLDENRYWDDFLKGKLLNSRSNTLVPQAEQHVPFYDWSYGCTPTAITMALAYWDNIGMTISNKYGNLVKHHFHRWDNVQNEWDKNVADLQKALAIAMSTDTMAGSTNDPNCLAGFVAETASRGYNFTGQNKYGTSAQYLSWAKTEVNNGRPFHLGTPGHSNTGVGYTSANFLIRHNTWWPGLDYVNYTTCDLVGTIVPGGSYGASVKVVSPYGDPRYSDHVSPPSQGEYLYAGNAFEIQWDRDYHASSYARLLYSTNGGLNWSVITSSTTNNGKYDWRIPSWLSSTSLGRVKVEIRQTSTGVLLASDGSWGNFNFVAGGSLPALTHDVAVNTTNVPHYYQFTNTGNYWNVVGIRRNNTTDDWDIELHGSTSFNNIIAQSTYAGAAVDFVVMGDNTPVSARGIKAVRYSGSGTARVEFEGGADMLTVNSPATGNWPAGDVVKIWDVYLTPGTHGFYLDINSGSADLDFALYGKDSSPYYAGRNAYKAISNSGGQGVDEQFTYNVTTAGWYGLCVWANNANSANFTLRVEAPGTWKGLVSTSWHIAGNWSAGVVPNASINVTIPSGTPYQPFIYVSNAHCNNLTINTGATLTVGGYTLNVNSNLSINGTLAMNNASGVINAYGDVAWNNGSTANFSASTVFWVYGNWIFQPGSNANLANGVVAFAGSSDKYVRCYSSGSSFNSISSYKTSGYEIGISGWSTHPLTINGNIYIHPNAQFSIYSFYDVILKGNVNSNSTFICNFGTVVLNGTSQSLRMNTGDYFNNLTFNQSGTVTINNTLSNLVKVNGDVQILSGVFNMQDRVMHVGGNWTNNAFPTGFNAGTGKVVFNRPSGHQYVYSSENFNILEADMGAALRINNAAHTVTCNHYHWTAGGIDVIAGTFTALDLVQNGIYGGYWVNPGGTINLTNSGTGTWVDLHGSVNILGGTMNIAGSFADWPYADGTNFTMTGGVLDVKTSNFRIMSGYTWTNNITGGTIRLARGFESQRADFAPSAGTFEFYGSSDFFISQSNGSTLHNVKINKSAKDGGEDDIKGPVYDERTGELLSDGGKANTITLGSNFTITGSLNIDAGTFNLGAYSCNVNGTTNIYGALTMTNAANDLTAYRINWQSGSDANVTAGTFHAQEWMFYEGTNAKLGTGNTAYVYSVYYPTDDDAEFGNLVAVPTSKVLAGDDGSKAFHPVRIAGNFTLQNTTWSFHTSGVDVIVQGNADIQNGGSLYFSQGNDFIVNGTLNLAGSLFLGIVSVATIEGGLTFPSTGWLSLNSASFFNNYNMASGFTTLNGKLTMNAGSMVAFPGRSINLGATFVNQISGGTLQFGRTFSATTAGTFQQNSGTIEFVSSNAGHYLQLINGNFANNAVINKPSGSLLVHDDLTLKGNLTIDAGVLNANNKTIQVAGNWANNVGTAAFTEGTGRVIFNGTGNQTCNSETFHILEVNKASGAMNFPGTTVCATYDWKAGGITANGGTFTALNLMQTTIVGSYTVQSNGTINLHQDATKLVDLDASISISSGTMNVFGGIPGSAAWWPSSSASLTMSGGVLDVKDQTIIVRESGSFTANISGGTIRTSKGYFGNRPDFTPTAGTFEFYGSDNAFISQSNGSTLHHVVINKNDKGDENKSTPPATHCKREGLPLSDGGKSGDISLSADFTVTNIVDINSGSLDLAGKTLNVERKMNVYGTLNMTHENDLLNIGQNFTDWLWFNEGSTANMTHGTIYCKGWVVPGTGSQFDLGINNTIYFTGTSGGGMSSYEPTASYGNIVFAKNSEHIGYFDGSATQPAHVKGSFTVASGNTLFMQNNSLTIDGTCDWDPTSYVYLAYDVSKEAEGNFFTGDQTLPDPKTTGYLELNSGFDLKGFLDVANGNVLLTDAFGIANTGILNINGGSFINNRPYSDLWTNIYGTLNMTDGLFELTYNHPQFYSSAATNISGGIIRTGGAFSAAEAPVFQPSGGTVEITGNQPAGAIYCFGDNFFHNLIINRSGLFSAFMHGEPVNIQNNFVVDNGLFRTGTSAVSVSGNTTINADGKLVIPVGSSLLIAGSKSLTVNNSGILDVSGAAGNAAVITGISKAHYAFNVESGGTIGAEYGIFENMDVNGINIKPGALVEHARAFTNCTFRNGQGGGSLLTINNDQVFSVHHAEFPENTWGGLYNVSKTENSGQVEFKHYTGGFAGSEFENDIYGRIDWFEPLLTADPLIRNVAPPAGTTTFDVISNLIWTVTESVSWLEVSHSWGSNNETIIVTYDANPSPSARIGYITLSADYAPDVTLTVIQSGVSLAVFPPTRNVGAAAGSTSFFVTSNTGWTVSESVPWLSVAPMSGIGNAELIVTFDSNTGNTPRSGDITVSAAGAPDVIVSVNQEGVSGIPVSLLVENETVNNGESECYDALQTITVQNFVVESGGGANLIAGENIIMLPGTHAKAGSYLHARITITGDFCGSIISMLAAEDPDKGATYDEMPLPDQLPDDEKDRVLFRVFPNPTTGMFTLELAGAVDDRTSSMEIFTLMGERVMSEQLFGDAQHQFDLTFRPKGIYIVRVTIGDKMGIKKLVKH